MEEVETFRRYAEECRRLAKSMKSEHKATLREMAEAWDQCAEEAECRFRSIADSHSDALRTAFR